MARPRLEAVYEAAGDADRRRRPRTSPWWRAPPSAGAAPSTRCGSAAGDRVLATRTTYVSSALQLLELERVGVKVEIVPDDAEGRARPRRAGGGAAGARGADRRDPRADLLGPGRAGRRDRRAGQGGRRPVPARRDPVGRPAAGRRRRGRLRRARHHRPQVPARAARHRLPLRRAATSSTGCGRARPTCAARCGRASTNSSSPTRRGASRPGRRRTRCGSGSAWRWPRRGRPGSRRSPRTSPALSALLRARLVEEIPGARIADPAGAASGIVTFVHRRRGAAGDAGPAEAGGLPHRRRARLARALGPAAAGPAGDRASLLPRLQRRGRHRRGDRGARRSGLRRTAPRA